MASPGVHRCVPTHRRCFPRNPGGESGGVVLYSTALPEFSGINQRAGMQLKYFGSKAWLAPHLDRLLGDVAVLHSPFFGSGKLEYYLAARRPGLEVRGVDAFKPVANLHRCYLRRDPVFLRSLLRLVGRRVDRRFYSGRLLPGALRGRAGRRRVRPAAQQLLGEVGLLRTAAVTGTEQRAASPAATLQRDRAAPGRGLSTRSALPGAPVHLR